VHQARRGADAALALGQGRAHWSRLGTSCRSDISCRGRTIAWVLSALTPTKSCLHLRRRIVASIGFRSIEYKQIREHQPDIRLLCRRPHVRKPFVSHAHYSTELATFDKRLPVPVGRLGEIGAANLLTKVRARRVKNKIVNVGKRSLTKALGLRRSILFNTSDLFAFASHLHFSHLFPLRTSTLPHPSSSATSKYRLQFYKRPLHPPLTSSLPPDAFVRQDSPSQV